MPRVASAVLFQIALLLLTFPAQYLISKWTGGTVDQRHLATRSMLEMWALLKKSYLNTTAWVHWLKSWIPKLQFFGEVEDEFTLAEEMALEELMHANDQGYFGVSTEARSPRPAYVLHRVGQVVMEKQSKMVGVIVGWDARLRAPPEWTKRKKYLDSELERVMDTPHYRILFRGPNSSSMLVGYIPQFNLKLLKGIEPDIPTLVDYFSHFNGERFMPAPWMQLVYPHD